MTLQTFELAPPRRAFLWDQALALAFTPAVTVYGAIHFFTGQGMLGLLAGLVGFVGTLIFAIPLARPQLPRVTLAGDRLEITSGYLRTSWPLASLDLAGAHRISAPRGESGSALELVTRPETMVVIPRPGGGELRLTPTDPAAFLAALARAR
jgi:hypothetical protein